MTEDTIVKVLNNTESYLHRCEGYCTHHQCYVTTKQMKRRKCINKNCRYFLSRIKRGGSV